MGSIARMDPKLPSKSQAGRPLQLLTRNIFFQSERPEPPLRNVRCRPIIPVMYGHCPVTLNTRLKNTRGFYYIFEINSAFPHDMLSYF